MSLKIMNKMNGENNREYAYRVLRYNIMTLQLLPGEVLNEGELSQKLKMSRTPVHEAILMLKEEALVNVYPQSGSKISLIDIGILNEGFFLRSTIEPKIIIRIEKNISTKYLEKLRTNLQEQEKVLGKEDEIDNFFKLDDKFHQVLYDAAEMSHIWHAMKRVSSHYDRVRYLDAIMNKRDLSQILNEHKNIFNILLVGRNDEIDLIRFYDEHLATYRKSFQKILENYTDFFNI